MKVSLIIKWVILLLYNQQLNQKHYTEIERNVYRIEFFC